MDLSSYIPLATFLFGAASASVTLYEAAVKYKWIPKSLQADIENIKTDATKTAADYEKLNTDVKTAIRTIPLSDIGSIIDLALMMKQKGVTQESTIALGEAVFNVIEKAQAAQPTLAAPAATK